MIIPEDIITSKIEGGKTPKEDMTDKKAILDKIVVDSNALTEGEIEKLLAGYQEHLLVQNHISADHSSADEEQEKHLDRLLELEAALDKDWSEVHKSEFIRILKKSQEGSPVILIKVLVELPNIPPEKVNRMIGDIDIRKQWDNVLSGMRIFGKIDDHVDHMYSVYKAPIGISNRDFCQRRIRMSNYKGVPYMIHFKSVNHEECPPVSSNVRANTIISGYIIRQSHIFKCGTAMTILTQTDIKGQVPTFVVNMAAARAPSSWCTNFMTNALKLIKEGKI